MDKCNVNEFDFGNGNVDATDNGNDFGYNDLDDLMIKDNRNAKKHCECITYGLIYAKIKKRVKVSKRTFNNVKNYSKILVIDNIKYKLIGNLSRTALLQIASGFVGETLYNSFEDIIAGIKTLFNIISVLGQVKRASDGIQWSRLILSMSKILLGAIEFFKGDFSLSGLIMLVLDVYGLYEQVPSWKAQGVESAILAGVSCFLPDVFVNFLKRMQLFTSAKFFDDTSLYYSVVTGLYDIIDWICSKVPGGESVKNFFVNFFNVLHISPTHLVVRDIEKVICDFNKDPKFLMSDTNRVKVKNLREKLSLNKEIIEWSRRSNSLKEILVKFERIVKIANTYNTQGREEPSCYIFEGPPACRKSVVVNKVIELLNEPCYCHLVKSVSDGKDWYDNYNDEEIFYMDDVGQQGISQWRTIINMVSSVKMPLECADANLKDTKFFNSNKILITTNSFSNLNGLCRNDCISDIRALWRRGFVFDFSRVVARGDAMFGEVIFKFFNIDTQAWDISFPNYLVEKCPSLREIQPRCNVANMDEFLLWIYRIIKSVEFVKKLIFKNSHVDVDLIKRAKDLEQTYLPIVQDDNLALDIFVPAVQFEPVDVQRRMDQEGNIYDQNNEFIDVNWDVVDRIQERQVLRDRGVRTDIPALRWSGEGFSDFFFKAKEVVSDVCDNLNTSFLHCSKTFLGVFQSSWFRETLYSYCKNMFLDLISSFSSFFKDNWYLYLPIFVLVTGFSYFVFSGGFGKVVDTDWRTQMAELSINSSHNSTQSVGSQVFSLDLICDDKKVETECFVSGRHIILPQHCLSNFVGKHKFFVVLYVNKMLNKRVIEYESVDLVYSNEVDDIAILALPKSFPSPFKSMAKWFKASSDKTGLLTVGCLLGTNNVVIPLRTIKATWFARNVKYYYDKWSGNLVETDLTYDIHGPGMCGSLIFSPENGIMGFHIAGNSTTKQGVARIFSEKVKSDIKIILEQEYYSIPFEIKEQKESDSSVLKLDFKSNASVPTKTNFAPSPLFNYFEGTREPADLKKFGRHTVKDVAKKSFSTIGYINEEEIEFGTQLLSSMIDEYDDLPMEVVVGGDGLLAPLNKDSSNGYGQRKNKTDYIDFENNCYTPLLKADLADIRKKIEDHNYPWDKFVWHETLKDELRGVEKEGEPRSFRVATIQNQVLCKEKFGNMVKHIIKHRSFNKIMVGVNPFVEWDGIYDELSNCELVMAADIKKYDGKMLAQVQRIVSNVLLSKYIGKEKQLCAVLLETLVHTLLFVMDDTYLTTHSFPSGHFLTAIVNSFVNRIYTGIWYKRMMKVKGIECTISGFNKHVKDFVYGDDKLNGITAHSDVLNAITLRDFFRSIGLDLTTSDKKEITKPGETLEQLEFLKRKFVFHHKIGRIMCPLDMRTLNSGLRFCDVTKDVTQVLQDKIHNYQREIYLHSNYEELLQNFIERMNDSSVSYALLPESYLVMLYTDQRELNNLKEHYK